MSAYRKASYVPGEHGSAAAPPSTAAVGARPMPTPGAGAAPPSSAGVGARPMPTPAGAGGARPMSAQQTAAPPSYATQQTYAAAPVAHVAPVVHAAPAPVATVVRAQALYPFQGEDDSELSFNYNDIIVVHRQGGDWWEGEVNGRRGLFPANYVRLV